MGHHSGEAALCWAGILVAPIPLDRHSDGPRSVGLGGRSFVFDNVVPEAIMSDAAQPARTPRTTDQMVEECPINGQPSTRETAYPIAGRGTHGALRHDSHGTGRVVCQAVSPTMGRECRASTLSILSIGVEEAHTERCVQSRRQVGRGKGHVVRSVTFAFLAPAVASPAWASGVPRRFGMFSAGLIR
jgi:hypothetical protein